MDPLEIMLDLEKAKPYYQAIFSADSHEVTGYQVLGYIETETGNKSLSEFFQDDNVPEDFKIEMDRHLHKQALEQFIEADLKTSIYLIVHQDYLMSSEEDDFIQEILSYEERGLDLSQVVIEIVEQDDIKKVSVLANSVKYLKTFGVKFAINDALKGANNLDRISTLEPDIIKINLASLQSQSFIDNYQNIIYSLSLLARKVGAELLFDGIHSSYQFHYAWRRNGRYYQGEFFSGAKSHFVENTVWKDKFKQDIGQFIAIERSNLTAKYQLTAQLNQQFHDVLIQTKRVKELDSRLELIAEEFQAICFRMYVTDGEGFQKTVNIEYKESNWVADQSVKSKNWSWRPYFIENVIRMNEEKVGILSDLYSDIETGEMIRTFSYPMAADLYLFMDISQMYMDDNPYLLW
ncbi:EAL domain, c-di-GMP-specific phosphodiesterase class I (or its enzymatically inactive variant) [Gracilibacillus ureilyticus]|uniref:EAL domain, c-di-GMP-specific phosphodiesterase class I (Or its enzymatically inactive variant) n=1 Tax=Gracilibacillus ureilyticus TaxID=531814 RepID=A0A1H9P4P4_9BACI|nr:EAL-associated domain-containing protein [Gracilibacillus ureilyticus]SER43142.1 EAL domain, c-di-GMP-specific phosphodiesterase class I (or its enzymatically inactive variant) [Gracilibacillus ureilyticus]